MTNRVFLPDKLFIRFILLLLFLTTELAFTLPPDHLELRFKTENHNTNIHFDIPQNWQIKILNNSPDQKIVLKISSDEKIENRDLQCSLPKNSGLSDFKVLPFKPQSLLLVLNLKEPLEFGWKNKSQLQLEVHDRAFRDPAEREYLRGLEFQQAGDLNKALSAYRKAVFLNRKHGNAYFKAAQIRFRFKQYHLAEINFKHALRLNCDSLTLYRDMANFYRAYGKTDLAEKYRKIYQDHQPPRPRLASAQPEDSIAEKSVIVQKTTLTKEETKNEPVLAPVKQSHSLPLHIIFYLVGSLVILIGILVKSVLFVRRKRKLRAAKESAFLNPDFFGSLDLRKEKILSAARQVAGQKEEEPVESFAELSEGLPAEEGWEEEPDTGESLTDTISANSAYSPQAKKEIARNLNLGIGEIELALNLKAQKRQVSREPFVETEIRKLVDKELDVSEIARRMKLGQGEVELYMALNKRPFETEPF